MPDIELLKCLSRESGNVQAKGELQSVYSCSCSCELTNTPAPCVRKAVCHIQELKNKLEEWCQKATVHRHDHSEGKNMNNIWRFDSVDSKIPMSFTELCIEGMGLCVRSNYENDTLGHFWKGTDGVLLKVMSLIERLESDKQEAKKALQKEKLKVQTLRRKQDSLSLWKQRQFPAAVQIEYEACIRDITELKWHLKVKKDQMQQVKNSLSHAEAQNCWLVKDIDFVKKHSPLVMEKLQLESKIMKQIKSAQTEASEMFTKLSNELSRSKQELETKELIANKEKGLMTMELKDSRSQLKDCLSDLQQLKSYWERYCTKVSKTEEKIALIDIQLYTMLLQTPALEAQETKINDTVMELRAKLEAQERELGGKICGITHLQKQMQTTRHEDEAELFECEDIFSEKRQELLSLHNESKEHEMETEDYSNKIHQSKQVLKQLQRDRKRILEKISQNEEEREQVKGELTVEAAQHTNTKARLDDLEQETFMWEQRMRKETDKLKMQLISEMKVVAALKGTVSSIVEEHNLVKTEYEREKNELLKEYEDVSSEAAQLETEMVALKEIYTEKTKKIADLKRKLSDILTERKRLCGDLEEQNSTCVKQLNSVKKAHSAASVRCEQTCCRIEELRMKSEECRKASDMMEHIATTMPHVIEELQSISDMLEYKHNAASVVMNSLESDKLSCRSRTGLSEEAHSNLLAQRQAVMLDIKANLKKALIENMDLAQEYRATQKALLIARQEAVCVFDKKNKAEASFHDYKQLLLLQRRMHKAMLKYFKHRSVYSQAELARFQALSNQNNQKMKALQEVLLRAICRISVFLRLLTDDPTTGHDVAVAAAADEQRRMDNDGLSRAMPTVQIAD